MQISSDEPQWMMPFKNGWAEDKPKGLAIIQKCGTEEGRTGQAVRNQETEVISIIQTRKRKRLGDITKTK